MPSNDTQSTEPQQSLQQTRRLPLSDIVNLIDTPSPKQTPKTNTRTIPEDPQTRKLFIQEVRHRVQTCSPTLSNKYPTESKSTAQPDTERNAPRPRPPVRSQIIRAGSSQPQIPPTITARLESPAHRSRACTPARHNDKSISSISSSSTRLNITVQENTT